MTDYTIELRIATELETWEQAVRFAQELQHRITMDHDAVIDVRVWHVARSQEDRPLVAPDGTA